MNGVLIFAIIAIVVIIAVTPMGRALFNSLKNLFIQDAMKNPKLAEGAFLAAIEEEQVKYTKAANVHATLVGELKQAERELANNQEGLAKLDDRMQKAASRENPNMDDLRLMADQRTEFLDNIEMHENSVTYLTPLVTEAAGLQRTIEDNIRELKAKKRKTVTELKMSQNMSSAYASMDDLRGDSATNKLLNFVKDNKDSARRQADGMKAVHEGKVTTQVARMEERNKKSAQDDYIQELLAKNKPGSNSN